MTLTPFDDYEIHGVAEFATKDHRYCEQVPDHEAEFWSLYGHIPDQGFECIGDFKTRQAAEEVLARITGLTTALADALRYLLEQTVEMDLSHGIELSEGEEDVHTVARMVLATVDQFRE